MKRFIDRHPFIARWIDRPHRSGKVLFGRYEIIEELGMGSYGIAYKGRDRDTGRLVVIKQARRTKGEDGRRLLQREADVLSRLRHPQIPARYDTFIEGGQPHLVMDYIDGQTVEDQIFGLGITYTEQAAFRLLLDVLDVVRYIHASGIVHRDLRIPNIIWRHGTVAIIDFGLACRMGERVDLRDDDPLEKRLRREPHPRSDFYALGHFTLFLLYSAYEPTSEDEKSWEEELDLSPKARAMLRKMLQLDAPYDHVDELIADVKQLLAENDLAQTRVL
ncbi:MULTISPECIES: serine/threonine protein kinase [Geobacillus]|jgi:serine/threonine protein kinase, bacterial|uniref:non-specific serine/threonine protein kinase n=2 Tax=Geobacillus thermodenitrificans TaxID=33940 RepID=A0ABY9QG20_GEOTD|nr:MULTISPECIES: serine/threonine-protein kinase [Geobacillus]ARP42667.1 Calcium-dependent protein kinase 2 [Geobacillus thermodenitrificans]ATO36029.1 serine/threonine protein kinase [Geobacillus thermodenitrificans]KQB93466.1 serine/threonine protein kinase [Geobacillus sp. PA-3]MED3716870.1 serine/threonine-protein kinase [Geobacillus thermodenitrificans]MED4916121.1 serine/threonine-protein kinase [Geobacillus thermodenitrificans]